jgi:hypothetical protein
MNTPQTWSESPIHDEIRNMNTDTPETDAMVYADQHHLEDDNFFSASVYWRICDLARRIERELTAVTEQRDRLAEVIEQLKSRLTQTQGAVTISRNGYVQELEQQRDRLAEALRKAISWGDSASHHILHRQNINWTYLNEAREALQSLTQPKKYDANEHQSFYP